MSLQNNSQFTIKTGRQVLSIETNDRRFEDFCREVIGVLEGGALILGTSASWDLGRDGVGAVRASGIYLCSSLRDDVDAKALGDIDRIVSTTKDIKRLYFCSSRELSEHKRSSIETALLAESDYKFPITVLGASQIIEMASTDIKILNKYYFSEIQDCVNALTGDTDEESEIKGLRLALISTGEDSGTIRSEIYSASIIDALNVKDGQTIQSLCKTISERLHLMRNLSKEAILVHLDKLQTELLISKVNEIYQITDLGRERISSNLEHATGALLNGRATIRGAIEAGTGNRLADDHFNKIWLIFEEHLVAYCISRGQDLVSDVSQLLGTQITGIGIKEKKQQFPFIHALADAVGETSSSPQQKIELKQAVEDIFIERTGPAIDWLVRLCGNFVAACSLGLEQTCGNAIETLLRRTTLIFDTDVVLSLMGRGEIDHDSAVAIANRWKEMRGKVMVAEPVLEEVAYHAWIAQHDFEQVSSWLPGSADDRQQYIHNVFARSFAELLARGEAKMRQWHTYIGSIRGDSSYSWGKVYSDLHSVHGIDKLPPRSSGEEALEKELRALIVAQKEDSAWTDTAIRNMQDKARRDAQLYAALVSYLKSLQHIDPSATCLLVSSARRLANAEAMHKNSGEPELVVSISTVLQLLSLAPNVSLGLSAMRAFLFDERPNFYSTDFERTVLRMVRASDELSMPWAKRTILMRSVREKMLSDAKSRGLNSKISELESRAFSNGNRENTIGTLKSALDAVAIDTKTARDNIGLRKKVEELEAALRVAKQNSPSQRTGAKPYRAPKKR